MKRFAGLTLLICVLLSPWAWSDPSPSVDPSASPDPLASARTNFRKGRYSQAASAYRKHLKDETLCVAASVGLAEVQRMQGEYEAACATLATVAKKGEEDLEWRLAMAKSLTKTGEYAAATQHAEAALEGSPRSARAILAMGELLERVGQFDEARKTYRSMEETIREDKYRKNAVALVALGKILDRYAILAGRPASNQARNILHNYFQEAYLRVDKTYWPAHIAAAEFLLSKHKTAGVKAELGLAAKINSKLPDVYVGQSMLALTKWQFEASLQMADKALRINPHLAEALYTKAACYMQWRQFKKVPAILEKILTVNPNHIEALSLMAAAYVRLDQDEKAKPFAERVRAIDPDCAVLPYTIGQWLVSGRQYEKAEGYLKKAHTLAPHQVESLAALGNMYMQTGQEKEALATLEKARQLDDYRGDVVHYLNVVRKLQGFAVRETEHFVVKVDKNLDLVLLDEIAEYMEEIYPEVTGDYGYEPKRKTIIEILPYQNDFSARIAGRGWVPTVGACTGPVIALTAPNKARGALGLHNWAQVLRHEFAHTVTLGMTGNRIPHWFTEACAVWQQKDKRAFHYVKALALATKQGRLFPIAKMDWGFIRPKRRGDRMLAYAQSEWALDFIIRTMGFEKVSKLLQAYAKGMEQAEVFQTVLGMGEAEFDTKFAAWAKTQVREWGMDPSPVPDLAKSLAAVKAKGEDADALATLCLAQWYAKKRKDAGQTAEKALKINPKQIVALRVLANVQFQKKAYTEAIETCRHLEEVSPTTATAPRILSKCYLVLSKKNRAKYLGQALAALELLKKRSPLDSYPYTMLATLYMQLGQPAKALPNLTYLHQHTMNDPKYARQIAEIYRTMGQRDLALKYFREILRINPYETSAHEGLASIYVRKKEFGLAQRAATNMTRLEPNAAASWNYLAKVEYRAGKAERSRPRLIAARRAAEKALAIEPKGQARQILNAVDAALEDLPPNNEP